MSKFELRDKIALVTGGGGTVHGIGKSIALAYAAAGANVVVVGRHGEHLADVVNEITGLGRQAQAVVADVTDPLQVDKMVEQALARFGRIDILTNSVAGSSFAKAEEISAELWTNHIALHLNATFFCCAAVSKVMIEQNGGKIVNTASSSGIKGDEFMAHYAAAKAGVINLTRSLAIRWAQYNINVNCIAPGRIEVSADGIAGILDDEFEKRKSTQKAKGPSSLQLPGKPQDIANAAVFFASAGSDLITGETLVVRGSEWASAYS